MRRPASTRSAADPVAAPPVAAPPVAIRIARIGGDGDGIGEAPGIGTLYVPFTLPGEQVVAIPGARRGDGRGATALSVTEASPARIAPLCPHFGACGGCAVQHWADSNYVDWKSGLLSAALARAGFADAPVAGLVRTPPGARRRMDMAVRRGAAGVLVGLHRARAETVVDLDQCPVLHPALVALIAPLRALLTRLRALRRQGSAIANLTDAGADLLLRLDAAPDADDRARLIGFARAHDLPRLHVALNNEEPEPICLLRPARLERDGIVVIPPPGGFLQASIAGETALVRAVRAALPATLPGRARIADLYAGSGTFSFALAAHARVAAFEGDDAAVRSLRAAASGAGLAGRIEATRRDLARQPLSAKELAGFAAVVLDPPHAGAAAQMPAIAQARPPRVIYVGCNPATLARDAAVLRGAGYVVAAATPVDQFLWSARLESVVAFLRQ